MLAQVKFLPREPEQTGDTRYVDIVVNLEDGTEERLYAKEGTPDWDKFHSFEKGQIIGVEWFQPEGRDRQFLRLTEDEVQRNVPHVANFVGSDDPFDTLAVLMNLYEEANRSLHNRNLPIEPTGQNAQKLAVTAFMSYRD